MNWCNWWSKCVKVTSYHWCSDTRKQRSIILDEVHQLSIHKFPAVLFFSGIIKYNPCCLSDSSVWNFLKGNDIICLFLSKQPVCIKDITPNLQSCEIFQEIKGSFKCKADIFLSLDPSDCAGDWAAKPTAGLDDEVYLLGGLAFTNCTFI